MLQKIHNRTFVKNVLALLGLIITLYFGWSFYPFGEWVGKQFLGDIPHGPTILGYTCASIMGGLVITLIFYKEYIKEDVKAYVHSTQDDSFEHAFNWFIFFVLALELFSVVFRCILLSWNSFSIVLFGVGIVGMGLSYVVGKVLHVQMNPPRSTTAFVLSPMKEELPSENHNHKTPASF